MREKEDYRDLLDDRKKQQFKEQRPDLIQAIRSEVSATKLTGDRHWDRFLEHIQGVIDQKKEQKQRTEADLCSPSVVDHEQIVKLKLRLREDAGWIDALELVQTLPQELQDLGGEARKWFRWFSTKAGS